MTSDGSSFDRRRFLMTGAAAAGMAGFPAIIRAQGVKLKIGIMLPYSGAYALLGVAIDNGFRLALKEAGGNFSGREVQLIRVNDESDSAKAAGHINRLLTEDKVDLVLGSVHSDVVLAMLRATRAAGVLHIIPHAGLAVAAGSLCAPNVFRTSFSNWQPGYAMGMVMSKRTSVKKMVTLSWRTAAGVESVRGFRRAYLKGRGRITRQLWLPFAQVDFRKPLAAIASLKPDAVYADFAGPAAGKFLRNYHEAGLMGKVPLVGPGFLTEGVLYSLGGVAEGVETALHYGDRLETPKNKTFRLAYREAVGYQPNAYAVAGYDAGQLFNAGMKAVRGDSGMKAQMITAMEKTGIDSPRGSMQLSRAHNPIHDQYLRRVVGRENRVMEIAVKALEDDPAAKAACKM